MLFKSNNFLCCYKVSGSRLKVQVKTVPNYRKNHHGNRDCQIADQFKYHCLQLRTD